MEVQRRNIVLHIFLSLLIHTQIKSVGSLNQASISSVDLKRHHLTVETMSFPTDFVRRQLAGGGSGGGGGGGGGSRGGGSSGGSSSGGGSRGGGGGGTSGGGSSSRGGSGGGGSRGGSGGGSGGNKGGKGGGGGGDGDGDGDGGGDGGGSSQNTRPSTTTQGGGRQVPIIPGGRFPSDGVRVQYSLALFIFTTCLVIMY